ncbi:MAG: site-specific integrase [Pirellulales bacterium]
MPRPSSSFVPKYCKHRASGQAVVTISGRDHYLGPHGTKASRLEYDRLIGEWLQNGRQSQIPQDGSITIIELCARYWKFAKQYYRKNGQSTQVTPGIKCALKYMKDRYGRTLAIEFGPLALKAIRQQMVEDGSSRVYVNDHIGRIKRMFKWAAEEELIPASIPQSLTMVSGLRKGKTEARETAPILPVDDGIVDVTMDHIQAIPADMVRFQRFTGCRPAEVCKLRPCDLNRSGDVWTYRPESHKTEHHGRDRTILIGPQAQGVLLKYLARDAQTHCFRPCDSEEKRRAAALANRKTSLSCGNVRGSNVKRKPKKKPGTKYTTDSYRRAIHRACDKTFPHPQLSKLKAKEQTDGQKTELRKWQSDRHWNPNQLRHTAATEIRREFGLEAAQVILGHSQANVTQVYAERDIAKGIEVAKRIG